MNQNPIRLKVSEDDPDVAYVKLPGYPAEDIPQASKTLRLRDHIGPYNGPDIFLDFDLNGVLIGIEILA